MAGETELSSFSVQNVDVNTGDKILLRGLRSCTYCSQSVPITLLMRLCK